MSDSNRSPDSGKKEPNDEFKVGARPWIIWLAILGAIPILILFRNQNEVKVRVLSYPEFIKKVESNHIRNGVVTYNPQTSDLREISGTFVEADSAGKPRPVAPVQAETEDENRRWCEAQLRRENRLQHAEKIRELRGGK